MRRAPKARQGGSKGAARTPYVFTPARRKRRFEMTPAKLAALRKATEANTQNWRLTPARLRAMRANGRKMQRASVEKFRMTEARRRALAENLRKAHAAPRTPQSSRRSRFNHLQHGLQARSFAGAIRRLREEHEEFRALGERLRRFFVPCGLAEEKVVRELVRAAWRRLRLFRAQAVWESKQIKKLCAIAPPPPQLDLEMTRARVQLLMIAFTDRDLFAKHDLALIAQVERELRRLLRLRSGGKAGFGLYGRESSKTLRKHQRLEREWRAEVRELEEEKKRIELLERLQEGGPEVEAAIAQTRAKLGWPT